MASRVLIIPGWWTVSNSKNVETMGKRKNFKRGWGSCELPKDFKSAVNISKKHYETVNIVAVGSNTGLTKQRNSEVRVKLKHKVFA